MTALSHRCRIRWLPTHPPDKRTSRTRKCHPSPDTRDRADNARGTLQHRKKNRKILRRELFYTAIIEIIFTFVLRAAKIAYGVESRQTIAAMQLAKRRAHLRLAFAILRAKIAEKGATFLCCCWWW